MPGYVGFGRHGGLKATRGDWTTPALGPVTSVAGWVGFLVCRCRRTCPGDASAYFRMTCEDVLGAPYIV